MVSTTTLVSEVMTRGVITVAVDSSLDDARRTMVDRNISGIPVVNEDGFPVGLLSQTDLIRKDGPTHPRGGETPPTVGEVMTPVTFTVPEDSPITGAAEVMARAGVHRVVILNHSGRISGIITAMDLVHWLAGH